MVKMVSKNDRKVIEVNGAPFLMLAGEVHNSSASSIAEMEKIYEGCNSGRRIRDKNQRGEPSETQANDRDRGKADPVAYHENVFRLRIS